MTSIKIAHAADIHVRPYAYMDEMEFTFDRFIEDVKERQVGLLVIAGDFFHSKLTVSSEYFRAAYKFFKSASNTCPVVVIPGNHDSALTNQGRLDAITPVIESLGRTEYPVIYSKKTESFEAKPKQHHDSECLFFCDHLTPVFHHFSIYDDKSKWPKKDSLDNNKINIALYHGAINNCIVDNGWVSRGNKDDLGIFAGFDFALLGDIHKAQFLSDDKRIAYPGSLRQNNFGEDIDKGYLLWEISGKDDFKVERVILPQKRYFFTLHLTSIKDLNDIGDLPHDCRIRVKTVNSLDLAEEIKIKEEIIEKYKPQGEVLILQPDDDISAMSNSTKVGNLDIIHDNIRDIEVQKQLIQEYLAKKGVSKEKIDTVVALDKVYHSHVDTDVLRNVVFDIKNLKMDNFLSYGKDNEINFEKLNGLIGVFGQNGTGKSTIFDAIFFLLQNGVYREGATKNGEYINRKCKRSDLRLDLLMRGTSYVIERGIKKVYVKGKDEPKIENEVNFYTLPKSKDSSLNGETTPDTNKAIRDLFGNKEDFEMMSLASQFGLTTFIDSRGTKRKESFAKFFDLGVFDTKFDLALKDHKEIKGKLKDCNKDVLLKSAQELREKLAVLRGEKEEYETLIQTHQEIIDDFDKELMEFKGNILPVKTFSMSIEAKKATIERLKIGIESSQNGLDLSLNAINLAKATVEGFKPVVADHEKNKAKLTVLKKQAELIKTIPGEDICRSCSLASHAFKAKDDYDELNDQVAQDSVVVEAFKQTNEYLKLVENIERMNRDLESCEQALLEMQTFEDQDKANHVWQEKINETLAMKKRCQETLSGYNKKLMEVVGQIAASEQRLSDVEAKVKVEAELTSKDEVYSLYLDAMGKNGISYWIVSKKLVLINKLVNQILSYAVPFRFSIEDNEEEKSIKIFVVDEKGKRPVELCSGGEKTVIALALRAALWKVCLLPKTPILILDESLSFLDGERHDSVIKLLNHLKQDYFDKVFLITHNEELKRIVDTSIYIDKKKGFSFVEVK